MTWTDEDDAILTEHWLGGVSAREIGKAIGRTRHSIIGRADRLKLGPHPSGPSKKPGRKSRKGAAAPMGRHPIPDNPPASRCQWPHGTPGQPDFHYCGEPVARAGWPYCREHEKAAYKQTGGES